MPCAGRRDTRSHVRGSTDMNMRRRRMVAARACTLLFLAVGSAASAGAEPKPIARIANVTYAGGVETFLPRMEFARWRPLTGRGDPLRNDPTYDYEPPLLERVRYWPPDRPEPDPGAATVPVPARADVLLLGTTARRPAQPGLDAHRRYLEAVLVPPPPPPPPPAVALRSSSDSPLYTLQEAALVYHSSTVDGERETFPLETVTSDYAGWGPTAPLDAPPTTNDPRYDFVHGAQLDATDHRYAFYRPMLSEAPPPPPSSTVATASLVSVSTTATAPTTAATTSDVDVLRTTDYVTQYNDGQTTERTHVFLPTLPPGPKSSTSRRPSEFVARPPVESQTAPPTPLPAAPVASGQRIAVRPMSMLTPMMSMPLGGDDDSPPASTSMHLIIQGHSKVKTYGSKAEPPSRHNSIRDDNPKPSDDRQVKHLHPLREPRTSPTERPRATAGDLRALVTSGEGSAGVPGEALGLEYDVSDGGDVPLDAYRRALADATPLQRPRRGRR